MDEPLPVLSSFAISAKDPMEHTLIQRGADLTLSQQKDLTEVVDQFVDIFSMTPVPHPPGPPWDPPGPPAEVEKKWLEDGGLLNAVVLKPHGSLHVSNNFQKLNQVSVFCRVYPLPQVDDLLEWLSRAQFIFTLDLNNGYWQLASPQKLKER